MKRAIRISSFFAGSMLVASCGGSSEPPPQQPQTFVVPPANPNAPPTQPTTTPVSPTAPTASATSAPGPTPPPAIFDAAAAAAIHLALQPRAASDAKGMKEDGAALGGMLNEGGELTQEFMLMPGKCYTILGQGLPMVSELDMTLSLKLPVPNIPAVLAADQTTGPLASIGAGKNCYKYALPIGAQVVLSVKATKGTGPVGAQVYSK